MYATVQDALDLAGPLENADLSVLNPQTILADRDVLHVPEAGSEEKKRISINTATAEELLGIGPSTAEKIVSYRSENGLFQSLEELMEVSGISPSKFKKLKDGITL